MRPRTAITATITLALAAALFYPGGQAAARVNPLTTIARQIQKPNMLLLLDTSSSMGNLPGESDFDWAEAGVDCDGGDAYCRTVGYAGRCYYTAGGRYGGGIKADLVPCDNDTQCTSSAYCRDGGGVSMPLGCKQDSDCDSGYCKGTCSNNLTKSCNRNSDCGSGNRCQGVCADSLADAIACTSNAQCPATNPCHKRAGNFCAGAGLVGKIKMCQIAQSFCRQDSDCAATPGDTCGPATSRMVIAKRVLNNIVQDFNKSVNFGFMTFTNVGYFPYKVQKSGTEANQTFNVYLSREQLEMNGCFSRTTGPSAACTVTGIAHTIKATLNSRYSINKGTYFQTQDVSWNTGAGCKLDCEIAGVGTGVYEGSYFTYVEKNATANVSDDHDGDGFPDAHADDDITKMSDYTGKARTSGTTKYVYIEAPANRRNIAGVFGNRFDEYFKQVGDPCGTADGTGFWDSANVRFMDTTAALPAASATGMANDIARKLRKVSFGGISPVGGTPTSRALKGDSYQTEFCSAYHYVEKVRTQNTAAGVGCRENFVLFVTDGYPAGDTNCHSAACSTTPLGAGCTCRAVLMARDHATRGNKLLVVGFSNAVATGIDRDALNNMAKAGGTDEALFAVREDELYGAITTAIYKAIRASYATSPLTVGASTTPSTPSTIVIDSRADFPEWRGHIIAYDTATTPATVKWDAASGFNAATVPNFWLSRNVWTHDATGLPLKITMDAAGVVPDAAKLRAAGLGVTDAEATLVARWLLGDPVMKNPAVLGAVVNSTPTEVALPDGSLTFVGASDGMLHAFHSRNQTISGQPYLAGREAFAYIPRDMLKVIRRQFAQGGQKAPPAEHIFGLANSPKIKKICVSNCAGVGTPVMSTVLVMPEGVGGNELFALDVGTPFGPTGVKNTAADPPMRLLWHSEYKNVGAGQGEYNTALGQTISLPGFYYAKTAGRDEYRLISASGYTDVASTTQGLTLVNTRAATGEVLSTASVRNVGTTSCAIASTEPTNPTTLSDIGIARRHGSDDLDRIAAAYVGDTWGNLFRYVPNTDASGVLTSGGTVSAVDSLTCNHPLHLAPTLVQIDRHNAGSYTGQIWIAQLTNSPFNPVTMDVSANYPASQLIIRKDVAASGSAVTADATWGPSAGRMVLSVTNSAQICGEWNNVSKTCTVAMPTAARPTASSTGIIAGDLESFALVTTWYVPTTGCVKGKSYVTVHRVYPNETVSQIHGERLPDEPVVGSVFAGGNLVVATSGGPRKIVPAGLGTINALPSRAASSMSVVDRYRRMGWTELP